MQAKSKKKLNLNHETVRRLSDREVLGVAGGVSRICTGTDFCTESCGMCTGNTCLC
ncbi:MAG TPA: class I lanthipeptide [Thermoanaerobaculia bacterium]|nr:class I lanthipeptide [Thermoanaerobaculia bacterium]